jgi:hypothetical protein
MRNAMRNANLIDQSSRCQSALALFSNFGPNQSESDGNYDVKHGAEVFVGIDIRIIFCNPMVTKLMAISH